MSSTIHLFPKAILPGGDANDDNAVDTAEFSTLVNAYGSANGAPEYDKTADFSCDDVVNIGDFGILINCYGTTGNP